jgi:hypothetical protein
MLSIRGIFAYGLNQTFADREVTFIHQEARLNGMEQLARLHHEETTGVDFGRLEELIAEHGEAGAERHVGRMLECIAVRLNKCERAWDARDNRGLRNAAQDVVGYAAEIGLTKLETVANDVLTTLATAQPAAQGATVARLVRIGEASLMCAWDLDSSFL